MSNLEKYMKSCFVPEGPVYLTIIFHNRDMFVVQPF